MQVASCFSAITAAPVTQKTDLVKSCDGRIVSVVSAEGASAISQSSQRTLSIRALHSVQYFCHLIILIQTESLCSLFQTNSVFHKTAKVSKKKRSMTEKIYRKPKRDWTKGSRGQVYQSVSTLQRLNGLMAAKCCDLGTQGRFKAVPGTRKLLQKLYCEGRINGCMNGFTFKIQLINNTLSLYHCESLTKKPT